MKLNIGVVNRRVNWNLSEALYLIRHYNIKKIRDHSLRHPKESISKKRIKMGLPAIIRKTERAQRAINKKIYQYVVTVCNHYNKHRKLNLDMLFSLPKAHRKIVMNSFPKCYFDRAMKETQVLEFIERHGRNPSLRANNNTERRLGQFMNMEQYHKRDRKFLKKLAEVKSAVGIKSRVGTKKPQAEQTMKELVAFIRKRRRLPRSPSSQKAGKNERRLGRFFSQTCTPTAVNSRPDLVKPHLKLIYEHMDKGGTYYHSKKFYERVLNKEIKWIINDRFQN